MKPNILPMALILATSLLAGCGGGSRVTTQTKSAGQQLQDLDKARADGLVTEREYERMRKRIVREND